MASWGWLPVELRTMIWEFLIDDVTQERFNIDTAFTRSTSIAACASVNREWQAYFEPVFFRQLVLEDSNDVTLFSAICRANPGRLDYIRHLRLHFTDVTCDEVGHDIEPSWSPNWCPMNSKFAQTLWPLLATLGTWTPSTGSSPGLALELSAGPWDDGQDILPVFRLQRNYPFETAEDLARGDPILAHQVHAHRTLGPPYGASALAFVRLGNHRLDVQLSSIAKSTRNQVSAQRIDLVRELVIRRRFLHLFSYGLLARLLVLGRRSIRTLRIETYNSSLWWGKPNFDITTIIGQNSAWLGRNKRLISRSALEAIHLHEEPKPYDGDLLHTMQMAGMVPESLDPEGAEERHGRLSLSAQAIVDASRSLKHVSVSGLLSVGASGFFKAALLSMMKHATRNRYKLAWLSWRRDLTMEQLEGQIARFRKAMEEVKQSGYASLPPDAVNVLREKHQMAMQSKTMIPFLWPHLQTLAVGGVGSRYAIIKTAGLVALEMPQLQILEIWSLFIDESDPEHSPDSENLMLCDNIFLFRFEAASPSHHGLPTVTLRGSRDMRSAWDAETSASWRQKAKALSPHPLCVEFNRLPGRDADMVLYTKPQCGIIKYLLLRDRVLDPVSRSQMELEALYEEGE